MKNANNSSSTVEHQYYIVINIVLYYTQCYMIHRYLLRVTMVKRISDVVKELPIAVHALSRYPETNNCIKMEVGIEECLHIEFEYNKSKFSPHTLELFYAHTSTYTPPFPFPPLPLPPPTTLHPFPLPPLPLPPLPLPLPTTLHPFPLPLPPPPTFPHPFPLAQILSSSLLILITSTTYVEHTLVSSI